MTSTINPDEKNGEKVHQDDGGLNTIDYSVTIVGLVTFVGDCARGILFPVLWPLCQSLGGTKSDYGDQMHIYFGLRL